MPMAADAGLAAPGADEGGTLPTSGGVEEGTPPAVPDGHEEGTLPAAAPASGISWTLGRLAGFGFRLLFVSPSSGFRSCCQPGDRVPRSTGGVPASPADHTPSSPAASPSTTSITVDSRRSAM